MPSELGACRLRFSWFELAALVVTHGRHPFAVLSADVIGKLCSTEQTDKDGGEVSSHEAHWSSSRTWSLLET